MKQLKLISMLLILLMLATACTSAGGNNQDGANTVNTEQNEMDNGETITIGIIQYMDHVSLEAANKGFQDEMKDSNLNVEFDIKNANGDASLTSQIAGKFKSDDYDLVYAIATPAAQAMQMQITNKPVIFSAVTDPVGAKLVESIEEPGGNVTGVSDYIDPKIQLERFLEIYPKAQSLGVIYNTGEQNSRVQVEELKKVAAELDLEIKEMGVTQISDIPTAITSLSNEIDGLFALTDNMVASATPIVSEKLLEHNLPSVSAEEGQVKNGLLFSEGINYYEHGRQAARMAIKALEGTPVEDIAVEYNEKNTLLVNDATREALGLDAGLEAFSGAKLIK